MINIHHWIKCIDKEREWFEYIYIFCQIKAFFAIVQGYTVITKFPYLNIDFNFALYNCQYYHGKGRILCLKTFSSASESDVWSGLVKWIKISTFEYSNLICSYILRCVPVYMRTSAFQYY